MSATENIVNLSKLSAAEAKHAPRIVASTVKVIKEVSLGNILNRHYNFFYEVRNPMNWSCCEEKPNTNVPFSTEQ